MTGLLVDSDVLINVLRNREPSAAKDWQFAVNVAGSIFYSPVSQTEIRHGMKDSERAAIEHVFSAMICLPIDDQIGRMAGDFMRTFHRSHGLLLADALIAATASLHTLPLWTNNHKHFPMKDLSFFRPQRLQ